MAISCNKINENLLKILEEKNKNKFRPYIDYIYFPHFKNLSPFTRIEFNFPITILIGTNGTNKSSILKSLEACCPGISLGNRWFSTHIDPIRHKPNLPCFVYGYMVQKGNKETEAQVLYSKPYRKGDIDYWETSKYAAKYKMTPLPIDPEEVKFWGLEKQRWSKIQKPKPIYITFRDSISAFDKFYYYGDSNPAKSSLKERRLTIRRYSNTLNKVINRRLEKLIYNKKNRVSENISLSDQGLEYVSYILDMKYTEIKLVKHTFYTCEGYTCKFIRNSINYSEAFAGSGEFVVIRIVKDILDAKPYTLVLIDEPEVSLHPGAQEKLLEFIVEQTLRKKLQVVIATHSPAFIRSLPKDSIKVLVNDPLTDQTRVLKQSCPPAEAFHYIGEPLSQKITFIVEDKLAEELVKYAISGASNSIKENIQIEYYGGGSFDILNNFGITNALSESANVFILLDGDQRGLLIPDPSSLTEDDLLHAKENILNKFSNGDLQIPQNSNESDNEKIIRNKKLLRWFRKHILFLPTNLNPEGFIWTKTTSPIKDMLTDDQGKDYKLKFEKLSHLLFPASFTISSENIFNTQLILLKGIEYNDPDLEEIRINIIKVFQQDDN